jgi:hypothetical protein
MKDELTNRFCKAFYGEGSNYDKALAAFDVSDFYEASGRPETAAMFESIAEYYSRLSLEDGSWA